MDPITEWNDAVAELMQQRRLTKAQATRELAISNAELHQRYIAAYTAKWGEACRRPEDRR